ncbi:MAG: tRNA (adenosine(37)-N6)-threonylcarbamoyltransferase complex ATPase subunit type 1 TsaE [Planctomycetes bacterium GWF2_42_9]|nr:MAG: tRNA (adenosine(37)-N6)-threonylcarbamoyltransferase complex ATPase subunit type 1 TsaE [Planctomycetes bacterium GWF2_42_9]
MENNNTQQIISESIEQTFETGKQIGQALQGGMLVCLTGTLGSGKTTLIKGIAAGMNAANPQHVNSPTFVIVNEYQGRLHIFHIDAYRINSIKEFEALGFEDYIGPESIVLIEWADKVSQALDGFDKITIEMRHHGPQSRIINITGLADLK